MGNLSKEEIEKEIKKMVRYNSEKFFCRHFEKEEVEVKEIDLTGKKFLIEHWMNIILLGGPELNITFKVHYSSDSVINLIPDFFLRIPDHKKEKSSIDYMKEFCNLSIGRMKNIIIDNDLDIGMSLPLSMRGVGEVFFPSYLKGSKDQWSMGIDNHFITCSSIIEIKEPEKLQGFDPYIQEDVVFENIDFLN